MTTKGIDGLPRVTLAGRFAALHHRVTDRFWSLRVRTWALQPDAWPRGERLRIVILADLHAGVPHMGPQRIAEIVYRANRLQGDLVVLLGDYRADHRFQTRAVPIAETAGLLAGLSAPLGVWAVQGNHDWCDDAAARKRRAGPTETEIALTQAGIPVLENRAVRLGFGARGFWLAGLGSQVAFRRKRGPQSGADDLPGVLAQIAASGDADAPVILLAHEPDLFAEAPPVALMLSGHTHGGQIRMFGHAPVVPSAHGRRYAYGHVQEGGRDLVVSGGIGCSGLPLRIGMAPELTVVDLS